MDNQNWSRAIYKRTIFRLVIWAIRKYFPYGLENIWGTDKKTKTIVAYKWNWTTNLERAIKNRYVGK